MLQQLRDTLAVSVTTQRAGVGRTPGTEQAHLQKFKAQTTIANIYAYSLQTTIANQKPAERCNSNFPFDSIFCGKPIFATMRPTQILSVGKYRHLKLTTKDVGRGFYKGNRTGSMGRHTKYGGYIIEWSKVRTYVVPQNLSESKLTPFVSREVRSEPGDYKGLAKGPQDPYFYVEQWKRYNGVD